MLDWSFDSETRAVLATGQTLHWAFDRAQTPPTTFVNNWFFPHNDNDGFGDEAAPVAARYVGWVTRLPVWESPAANGKNSPRAVALPLDAGATLLLAQPFDLDLDSAADWHALHAAMVPRRVELQVPFFKGWHSSYQGLGEAVINIEGLIALSEAVEVGTREQTRSGWGEDGLTVSTLALAEIALPEPPPPPQGQGSIMVVNGFVDFTILGLIDGNLYIPPPLDFVLNRPFRWALLDRDGQLVASGAVSEGYHLVEAEGALAPGWHESLWFGYAWRQDREWMTFYTTIAIGEEDVYETTAPSKNWRYHADLGWIHLGEPLAAGMWYWDAGLREWFWTKSGTYPWVYGHSRGWAFFLQREGAARWFYFDRDSAWESISD